MAIVGYACEDVKDGDMLTINTGGDTVNLVAKTINHNIHHGVIENIITGNVVPSSSHIPECITTKMWEHLYVAKLAHKPHGIIEDKPHEGIFDFYEHDFSYTPWTRDITLTKRLFDSGGKLDKELKKIQFFPLKPKPHAIIEDKPKPEAGYIPVPKLVLNLPELESCAKTELERRKFQPIVNEGDVAWNYNDDFQGKGKITSINYVQDYEHVRAITIEAILTD